MIKNNKTHKFIVIAIFAVAIIARLIVSVSLLATVAKSGKFLDEYMSATKAVEPVENDPVYDCYHALPKSREEKGTAMDNLIPMITEDSATMYKTEIETFTKAINKDGKNACLFLERGKLYLNSGLHDKALADFSKAIEISPKDTEIYDWRGSAYQRLANDVMSNFDMGMTECDGCQQPDDEKMEKEMARLYQKAIEDYNIALKLEPGESYFYHRRAVMYMASRSESDVEKGIKDYEKAVSLDPDNTDLIKSYAEAMYEKDKMDKAIEIYTKALVLSPKNPDLWAGRGDIYYLTDDYKNGIEDCSKALDIDNKHHKARSTRADLYMRISDYKSAIKDYTALIEPGDTYYYHLRAEAKIKNGDYDGAIADYDTAEKVSDNPEMEIYGRSRALMAKNDFDGAAAECSKILKNTASFLEGDARTCRCEALYKMGKIEDAKTECKNAIPHSIGASKTKALEILGKIEKENN